MAVLPVSSINLDNKSNNINFTGKKGHKQVSIPEIENNSGSNSLAKVPLVVMIAMTPAMMDGKTPLQFMPISNENVPELVVPQPAAEVNDATYVARPAEFQQSYPLGVAYLSEYKIQQIKPAIGNGVKANLVLAAYPGDKDKNIVDKVYYVKNSFKSNNSLIEPPLVQELIYHNIGKDKEFLGIMIQDKVYQSDTYPKLERVVYREVRLDDVSAQFLLDFNAQSTKWGDKTGIKFKETTNPNVSSPRVIEY